jgi:hypothetical protein
MLSFAIAFMLMLVVVGGSMRWAVREQRRRNSNEEGHASGH